MLSRRILIKGVALYIGAALLPELKFWSEQVPELPIAGDEVLIISGWVLRADDLVAVFA
jgi:hypothetical protein